MCPQNYPKEKVGNTESKFLLYANQSQQTLKTKRTIAVRVPGKSWRSTIVHSGAIDQYSFAGLWQKYDNPLQVVVRVPTQEGTGVKMREDGMEVASVAPGSPADRIVSAAIEYGAPPEARFSFTRIAQKGFWQYGDYLEMSVETPDGETWIEFPD